MEMDFGYSLATLIQTPLLLWKERQRNLDWTPVFSCLWNKKDASTKEQVSQNDASSLRAQAFTMKSKSIENSVYIPNLIRSIIDTTNQFKNPFGITLRYTL